MYLQAQLLNDTETHNGVCSEEEEEEILLANIS